MYCARRASMVQQPGPTLSLKNDPRLRAASRTRWILPPGWVSVSSTNSTTKQAVDHIHSAIRYRSSVLFKLNPELARCTHRACHLCPTHAESLPTMDLSSGPVIDLLTVKSAKVAMGLTYHASDASDGGNRKTAACCSFLPGLECGHAASSSSPTGDSVAATHVAASAPSQLLNSTISAPTTSIGTALQYAATGNASHSSSSSSHPSIPTSSSSTLAAQNQAQQQNASSDTTMRDATSQIHNDAGYGYNVNGAYGGVTTRPNAPAHGQSQSEPNVHRNIIDLCGSDEDDGEDQGDPHHIVQGERQEKSKEEGREKAKPPGRMSHEARKDEMFGMSKNVSVPGERHATVHKPIAVLPRHTTRPHQPCTVASNQPASSSSTPPAAVQEAAKSSTVPSSAAMAAAVATKQTQKAVREAGIPIDSAASSIKVIVNRTIDAGDGTAGVRFISRPAHGRASSSIVAAIASATPARTTSSAGAASATALATATTSPHPRSSTVVATADNPPMTSVNRAPSSTHAVTHTADPVAAASIGTPSTASSVATTNAGASASSSIQSCSSSHAHSHGVTMHSMLQQTASKKAMASQRTNIGNNDSTTRSSSHHQAMSGAASSKSLSSSHSPSTTSHSGRSTESTSSNTVAVDMRMSMDNIPRRTSNEESSSAPVHASVLSLLCRDLWRIIVGRCRAHWKRQTQPSRRSVLDQSVLAVEPASAIGLTPYPDPNPRDATWMEGELSILSR